MKPITNYKDLYDENSNNNCSFRDNINIVCPVKDIVLDYFKQIESIGNYVVVTCSATDRITGKSLNQSSIKTFDDGDYYWTNEEIYLFNKYDLKLNDDFIEHVLSKNK